MAKSTAPRAPANGANGGTAERSNARKKSMPPAPATLTAPAEPTYEQIAERAYGLWLSRGAQDGDAYSDWLRAENELRRQH
ncbi:MAG TPA: DUF2934 domain-containing protein [Polyangiales bacterium]